MTAEQPNPSEEFTRWWHDQTCPAGQVPPLPDDEAGAALEQAVAAYPPPHNRVVDTTTVRPAEAAGT